MGGKTSLRGNFGLSDANCWLYVPPFIAVPGAWAFAGFAKYAMTSRATNQREIVLISYFFQPPA